MRLTALVHHAAADTGDAALAVSGRELSHIVLHLDTHGVADLCDLRNVTETEGLGKRLLEDTALQAEALRAFRLSVLAMCSKAVDASGGWLGG